MSGTPHSSMKIDIAEVPAASRYEISVDGVRVGFLDYALQGDTFTALHTEIEPAHGGRGLGKRLVAHVLNRVRDTGMALRPVCPFVKAFLQRHPEYDDLVAARKG